MAALSRPTSSSLPRRAAHRRCSDIHMIAEADHNSAGAGASSSVDQPNPPTARLPSEGRRRTVGWTAPDLPSVEQREVGVSTGFTMLARVPR